MRVTFILPYAGLAGGIRVVAIYAKKLQERGHSVLLVSTPWIQPGRRARAFDAVHRMIRRLTPLELRRDPSHLDGLDLEHLRIDEARPVVDSDLPDADVVVATWWETAPWVANLADRKGAKAYFVQDYGAHAGQPLEQVAATWRLPLHKLAISKWLIGLVREHSSEDDIDYVPNAVDLDQFQAPKRGKQIQPTVGFQFNPAPQKGCDTVIGAIEIAAQHVPGLRMISYGPGDPKTDMPLPKGARHWQYAPDDKLKDIYSGCDVWLFGSRLEGFGLPILEAMACRTPVIATPAGAAPELLADGGGKLVNMDDPQDMAAAIMRIINLPDSEWRALSAAAHRIASRYTWDDATDLFEASLRQAIVKSHRQQTQAVHAYD